MRDIRPDLRERLAAIARERARLDQVEAGIKALLEQEEHPRVFISSSSNGDHEVDGTPLTRFILATLRHARPRALAIDDFKEAALKEGFDFGKKAPGRVLHRAMTGIAQGDRIEKVNGKWRLKEATQ